MPGGPPRNLGSPGSKKGNVKGARHRQGEHHPVPAVHVQPARADPEPRKRPAHGPLRDRRVPPSHRPRERGDLPRVRGRAGFRGRCDEVPDRTHHGHVESDGVHAAGVRDDEVVRHLSGTRPNLPDDQASPPVLSGEGPRAAASRRERVDGDVGPSVSDLRFRPKSDNRLASLLYPCPSSQSRAREATGRQEMTRMKLGVVWLIGFVLGIVFGLLTFIGAGLGAYWILIGGLVIGFLTGFLLKEMGKSLGFGFLSAFLGFTVGGIIVVVALAPVLTALPFLGGFLGILIVIVAVVFGIGAGIMALIGAPIGVLVGKRMAPAAQQPSAIAPPPSM